MSNKLRYFKDPIVLTRLALGLVWLPLENTSEKAYYSEHDLIN
ncbi:MAG: hypothetical protein SNJ77_00305 [Cytophagales bacterium]